MKKIPNNHAVLFRYTRTVGDGSEEKPVYVLWIRHCFGCHNYRKHILSGLMYRLLGYTSLCTADATKLQEMVSTIRQIRKDLPEDVERMPKKYYSSVLPRAMMTAGMAQAIMEGQTGKEPIQRMWYVSEQPNILERSGWVFKLIRYPLIVVWLAISMSAYIVSLSPCTGWNKEDFQKLWYLWTSLSPETTQSTPPQVKKDQHATIQNADVLGGTVMHKEEMRETEHIVAESQAPAAPGTLRPEIYSKDRDWRWRGRSSYILGRVEDPAGAAAEAAESHIQIKGKVEQIPKCRCLAGSRGTEEDHPQGSPHQRQISMWDGLNSVDRDTSNAYAAWLKETLDIDIIEKEILPSKYLGARDTPDLKRWEAEVLPTLESDTLHVIVSHGKTMMKYLREFS